jgi:hypothetical protein
VSFAQKQRNKYPQVLPKLIHILKQALHIAVVVVL